MRVIEFPGAAHLNKVAREKVKIERPRPSHNNQLFLEEICFTCPNCNSKSNVKFSGLIFRSLELFCGNCGSRYTVCNPAFSKK